MRFSGTVCVQADEDDSELVFLIEMYGDSLDTRALYMALP